MTILGAVGVLASADVSPDPLSFFAPDGFVNMKKRARIDAGAIFVDILPASDGEIAVFGAERIRVGGDRVLAWMRQMDALQKGRYVPVAERFSDPPRIEDLDSLVLDAGDLASIKRCQPGKCEMKLSKGDIERLHQRISQSRGEWQSAVQAEFRQIMLDRALTYLSHGTDGLPPAEDHETPVGAGAELDMVLSGLQGTLAVPSVTTYLRRYPHHRSNVESYLYWSKDTFDGGKAIISITHVSLMQASAGFPPQTLVASKQVFATHYLSTSLSLIAVTNPAPGGEQYLVYTRRLRVDLFQGIFGGLLRRMVAGRIQSEGPPALDEIKRRIEGGEPPANNTTR